MFAAPFSYTLRGMTKLMESHRSTVLDKIIEFTKISAGLNFYVRALLR